MCKTTEVCNRRWKLAKALASRPFEVASFDIKQGLFGSSKSFKAMEIGNQDEPTVLISAQTDESALPTTDPQRVNVKSGDSCHPAYNAVQPVSPTSPVRIRSSKLGVTQRGHARLFTNHVYRDHSDEAPASSVELTLKSVPLMKGGVLTPFPLKLHAMLASTEEEELTEILGWMPHGRAFIVRDKHRFISEVMPRFFGRPKRGGAHKYASFRRQLNLYGFQRLLKKGPDHGCYYHEMFLRHRVFLSTFMKPIRVKGTSIRPTSTPESEPDFEKMPPLTAVDDISDSTLPYVSSGDSLSTNSTMEVDDPFLPLPWQEVHWAEQETSIAKVISTTSDLFSFDVDTAEFLTDLFELEA